MVSPVSDGFSIVNYMGKRIDWLPLAGLAKEYQLPDPKLNQLQALSPGDGLVIGFRGAHALPIIAIKTPIDPGADEEYDIDPSVTNVFVVWASKIEQRTDPLDASIRDVVVIDGAKPMMGAMSIEGVAKSFVMTEGEQHYLRAASEWQRLRLASGPIVEKLSPTVGEKRYPEFFAKRFSSPWFVRC